MSQKIQVPPEALNELASRLRGILSELGAATYIFDDDGSIVSRRIDDALGDFCGAWSDKRDKLLENLRGASSFLDREAEEMRRLDGLLAGGLGRADGSNGARPTSPRTQSGGGKLSSHDVSSAPTLSDYDHAGKAHDQNTARGFYSRNCTDYTAWALNRMLDDQNASWNFENTMTRAASGEIVSPGGKWGNATHWLDRAVELGYGHDSTPKVGSVAYWSGASSMRSYGHVAIVQEVRADGSVVVDSYNGYTGAPMPGTYAPGSKGWPTEFLHIVPGT